VELTLLFYCSFLLLLIGLAARKMAKNMKSREEARRKYLKRIK